MGEVKMTTSAGIDMGTQRIKVVIVQDKKVVADRKSVV